MLCASGIAWSGHGIAPTTPEIITSFFLLSMHCLTPVEVGGLAVSEEQSCLLRAWLRLHVGKIIGGKQALHMRQHLIRRQFPHGSGVATLEFNDALRQAPVANKEMKRRSN